MLLTVSVKLLADADQKRKLLAATYKFNAACNWLSRFAFDNKTFGRRPLQKATYYDLRSRFDLSAQFTLQVIAKVADSYADDKSICHQFKRNGAIGFDRNCLSWKKLDAVSISSLEGRLHIPIAFGKYANLAERVMRKSAKLICVRKKFYLQVAIEIPEANQLDVSDYLGVDMGITNLATTSNNKRYSGEQVDAVRERYETIRSALQSAGTKSAKRHLKKLSKRERRFKRDTNHIISKQIVSEAKALGIGIAVEDLQGITKRTQKTVSKSQRSRFGKWAFYELLKFIVYKAAIVGIPIARIDPRNTSRTCSQCSHCEKANRHGEAFCCKKCGMRMHADVNASINIQNRAISAVNLLQQFLLLLSNYIRVDVNQPIVAIKKQPLTFSEMSDKPMPLGMGN